MPANPTVIIGLGGTGKWVLTYIKKNLLETYSHEVPPTVRLLCFDTAQEQVAHNGRSPEEDVRVGNVQLDPTELIYLGGNIWQICQDIRNKGSYPHIGSWLQADTYLKNFDPDAFDIAKGAGQKRPFGRMAVFYDLQAKMDAELTGRIRQAIIDVGAASQQDTPIEIFIVASLVGGTGSGMFIDVAHLVRWFASQQQRSFAIRGFLALQNTFGKVLNVSQVAANTAAAQRELDRFMLVFDQEYPITYNPTDPNLTTIYGKERGKLLDNCYLLDAARDKLPLTNIAPKSGVYPSIADCITTLLDASAGDTYAQHYKNVNTRIAEVQQSINQPIYSSLGTYTMILPVEDIITSLSYRFTIEVLSRHLLRVEQHVDEYNRQQIVLVYDGDPHEQALAFLRMSRSPSGIDSTTFIQLIYDMLEWNPDEVTYQRKVAEQAADDLTAWLLPLASDPAIPEAVKLIREDLASILTDQVQPSHIYGDKDYGLGCDRVAREVDRFMEEYLGQAGKYRKALHDCVSFQRQRYRQLLQEYLLHVLNGPHPENPEYQRQRRGQLGFAQDLLKQLSKAFVHVTIFIEQVLNYRAKKGELLELRTEVARRRQDMEVAKQTGSLFGGIFKGRHPMVLAQRAYLEAVQNLIECETRELLIEFLRHTSETLRQVTEEHKQVVDDWIKTLIFGFTGTFTDSGVYQTLCNRQDQHSANREEKKHIKVHEYVTDPAYEDGLYRRYTRSKHDEVMATLVWRIKEQSGVKLTLPGLTAASADHAQGRGAVESNLQFLFTVAQGYFRPLRRLTIAERLRQQYDEDKSLNIDSLTQKLFDKCSPLVRFDPSKQGSQKLSRFICVHKGREVEFFNELGRAFGTLGKEASDNQICEAANPHTCTILTTIDVLSSNGILPCISAEEAYFKYQGDPRLLHIFPAEVNAVRLEAQLPRIREPRRKFAPRLIAMLEDHQRIELFILCYLYRMIRIEPTGIQNRFVLDVISKGVRGVGQFDLTKKEHTPSLFTAMETFIFNGSDINNPTARIDFNYVERDLRHYEARVMGAQFEVDRRTGKVNVQGGDESCLINLLEERLDREIDQLRRSDDLLERDLAALMHLVVDGIIKGLHRRLASRNQEYNPEAKPLVKGGHTHVVVPLEATDSSSAHTNGVQPIGEITPDAQLKSLEQLHSIGMLTQQEYEVKLRELEAAKEAWKKKSTLKQALEAGVLTTEEYQSKLQALGVGAA